MAREEIALTGGIDLHPLTERVWEALAGSDDQQDSPTLFLHGNHPVRLTHADGRPKLEPLTIDSLRYEVAKRVSFYALAGKNGRRDQVPPRDLLSNLLAATDNPLPQLDGIVYTPVIAESGEICATPGYSPHTRLWLHWTGEILSLPVDHDPTKDTVRAAVDQLSEPFQDFPFLPDDDASFAHTMTLLLQPFVRHLIKGRTPMFWVTKPEAGTGASLLTDTALYPACGEVAHEPAPGGGDDEEWRKQITTILRKKNSAIVFDNAVNLNSSYLAKLLTDPIWSDRLLQTSNGIEIPVLQTIVGNGNNPTVTKENARRLIPIRLDSGLAQPWLRKGFALGDLRAWNPAYRGFMIHAALTVIRAWFVAGCPRGKKSLGSYEEWAAIMGGILDVMEVPGFLEHGNGIRVNDAETDAVNEMVTQWWVRQAAPQGRGMRPTMGVKELVELVLTPGSAVLGLLKGHITQHSASIKFGQLLSSMVDKVVEIVDPSQTEHTLVLQIRRKPNYQGAAQYHLHVVDRKSRAASFADFVGAGVGQ